MVIWKLLFKIKSLIPSIGTYFWLILLPVFKPSFYSSINIRLRYRFCSSNEGDSDSIANLVIALVERWRFGTSYSNIFSGRDESLVDSRIF